MIDCYNNPYIETFEFRRRRRIINKYLARKLKRIVRKFWLNMLMTTKESCKGAWWYMIRFNRPADHLL